MTAHTVLFEERSAANGKKIALATLNVEKALNALSLAMIDQLQAKLDLWQQDDDIACVLLQGAGDKAFCAGGDIVQLYNSMVEHPGGPNPYAEAFFTREYRLDYLIHTYPKPIILWGNGIVMGGGLGLMAGASHRVVTESSRIAMPEISIGLYPDVGGTWFLNRMPGRCGLFLGLTGNAINAADALFVGLADRFIRHADKAAVLDDLCQCEWQDAARNHQLVSAVLREHERRSQDALPASPVREHLDVINTLTDYDTVAEVVEAITTLETDDKWLKRAADTLRAGSTTAMHLIWRQLRRGRQWSLQEVFRRELDLSVQCAYHTEFAEGVRALLIDKDRNPNWRYKTVTEVPETWIDGFFVSPWHGAHPLADL